MPVVGIAAHALEVAESAEDKDESESEMEIDHVAPTKKKKEHTTESGKKPK